MARCEAAGLGAWHARPAGRVPRLSAQQASAMSEDLAWKLLELGRIIDPPKTAALYAPMQQKEPYEGVKTERDVKYGAAERHLLDVFMPDTSSSARPVLILSTAAALLPATSATPAARSTTTSCCGR